MSADAKVWQDPNGIWCGEHDGPCALRGARPHDGDSYELREVLRDIERCCGVKRWEMRVYPDGKAGLAGYAD